MVPESILTCEFAPVVVVHRHSKLLIIFPGCFEKRVVTSSSTRKAALRCGTSTMNVRRLSAQYQSAERVQQLKVPSGAHDAELPRLARAGAVWRRRVKPAADAAGNRRAAAQPRRQPRRGRWAHREREFRFSTRRSRASRRRARRTKTRTRMAATTPRRRWKWMTRCCLSCATAARSCLCL